MEKAVINMFDQIQSSSDMIPLIACVCWNKDIMLWLVLGLNCQNTQFTT